jgi:hypothetical protein
MSNTPAHDKPTVKGRLIALFIGILFTIFAGEAMLRLTLDEVNYLQPKVQAHPSLGHAIVPHSGGHDAWGFRNKRVPQSVEIVAIGDSVTYGVSATADESWPSWLQKMSGRSVYNLGLGGYGPPDYKYLLTEYGVSLSPQVVIIGIFLGNDLPRSYKYVKGLTTQSVMVDEGQSSQKSYQFKSHRFYGNFRNWLSYHSLLYQVAKHELPVIVDFLRYHEAMEPKREDFFALDHPIVRTVFNPEIRLQALDQNYEENRLGLQAALEIFDETQAICKAKNIRCIFLLIPTKESVYWPYAKERLTGHGRDLVAAVVEQEELVKQSVIQHFETHDFEYTDALPAMRAAAKERPLYHRGIDGHPTGTGYGIIAEIVLSKIITTQEQPYDVIRRNAKR